MRRSDDQDPPAMLAPLHALRAFEPVELHGRELFVASLTHPVDERRGADPLLLSSEVVVQVEQLGVALLRELSPRRTLFLDLPAVRPQLRLSLARCLLTSPG